MLRVRNKLGHALDGIANGDVGDVPNTAMMRKLIEAGELELIQELAPPRIVPSDDDGDGASLRAQAAEFDRAWTRRDEQHRVEVDALRAELDAARAENASLREQLAAAASSPKGKAKKAAPEDVDAPTAPAKE